MLLKYTFFLPFFLNFNLKPIQQRCHILQLWLHIKSTLKELQITISTKPTIYFQQYLLVFQKSFATGHKYNWLGLFVGITLPKALPAWLGRGIRGQWIILRGVRPTNRSAHPSIHPSSGHKYSGKAQSFVLLTKRLLRRREFCSQSRQ